MKGGGRREEERQRREGGREICVWACVLVWVCVRNGAKRMGEGEG